MVFKGQYDRIVGRNESRVTNSHNHILTDIHTDKAMVHRKLCSRVSLTYKHGTQQIWLYSAENFVASFRTDYAATTCDHPLCQADTMKHNNDVSDSILASCDGQTHRHQSITNTIALRG